MSLEKIKETIAENNIEFIRFEVNDLYGVSRSKTTAVRHFEEKATSGFQVPSSILSYDLNNYIVQKVRKNEDLAGHWGNYTLRPDLSTFTILPWLDSTARVITDVECNGHPLKYAPRFVAKTQLERLQAMGYSLLTAHEHEFYFVHRHSMKPVRYRKLGRATLEDDFHRAFTYQVGRQLPAAGVDIECIETEYGAGQMEITYKPAFGLRAADNAHTFKLGLKEIAKQHDFIASFMTKPYDDVNANCNAVHICHSLWDADGKNSLLYDISNPGKLSKVAQHWMAGILEHAPGICILNAPTVNCDKRFTPHYFPINNSWGIDNRTALIRVLNVDGKNGPYLENRLGGGSSNPYLTLAAMVAAGIDGIQRQLPLPSETKGDATLGKNLRALPRTAEDALNAFLEDKIITESLGQEFARAFIELKQHEFRLAQLAKSKGETGWEFNYFFEYL